VTDASQDGSGFLTVLKSGGASGGVVTLFLVQTPPVLIAFLMSSMLYMDTPKENGQLREAFGWLAVAG